MKRLLTSLVLAMTIVVGQAQVKVAPKMEVGQKMVYRNVTNMNVQMQEITTTNTMAYEVKEKTADGFVVDMKLTDMTVSDGEASVGDLMNIVSKLVADQTVRIATDHDGVPTKIVNWEEVKAGLLESSNKLMDELYASHPEIAGALPKESLVNELERQLTEEELLKGVVLSPTSAFVMNGKTISNLAKESYKNAQDIKMSRTYYLSDGGKTITAMSKVDMTSDDMKKMIIEQIEQRMPAQAAAVKENIDAIISSGMLKIDGSETSVYEFQENGWLRSINYVTNMDIMGQVVKMTSEMTIKE